MCKHKNKFYRAAIKERVGVQGEDSVSVLNIRAHRRVRSTTTSFKDYNSVLAFTLVELSIVLVIIGLLVGATLAGKALLTSAETKTLLSEVQKLHTAIGSFQAVYKGLPGDITNATTYWSTAVVGNGNGKIDGETSDESFGALKQLALAGVLEGSYAGFTGLWTNTAVPGFILSSPSVTGNVIGAKGRAGAALYVHCCSGAVAHGTDPNYDYSRTLTFKNHISLFSINATITRRSGIVSPIEARDIDQKIDDAVPDTGLVGGSGSWSVDPYASTGCYLLTGSTSTYDVKTANKDLPGCQMQFAYDWD